MSSLEAIADSSENMCNIAGAMLWQINSRNGVFVNLAAASTWLIQLMHSALLLPLKILMFFIICLLVSSHLLLFVTWFMIWVIPSTRSAGAVDEVSMYGVWIMVLVLGWLFSNRLWNSWLLCVLGGWVFVQGGGVAVGW